MEVPIALTVVAGEYMDSATLIEWLKQPGDPVAAGEPVALVETAKAAMEVPAPAAGTLARVAFAKGSEVPVGATLGWIETEASAPEVRLVVTPAARRLAAQLGVDLRGARGTGPGGRITEADVRAAAGAAAPAAVEPAAPPAAEYDVIPDTPYRRVTAQRMAQSAAIPQFQLTVEADLTAILDARDRLDPAQRPTITAYLVQAVARALVGHPRLNSTYEEGQVRRHRAVNVGVAVATDAGLAVPVIHQADARSATEIDAALAELRDRAAHQRLRPDDVRGGTFTLSNLGAAGVLQFAALVNPPQVAILAAGAARSEPGGARRTCLLTLSCDHRALDGSDGAAFLRTLRALLADLTAREGSP